MMAPAVGRIRDRSTQRKFRRPAGQAKRGPVRAIFVVTDEAGEEFVQVGYAIGRQYGNAVRRNRLRRRLRAVVRELAPEISPGGYLLRPDPATGSLSHCELTASVRAAMITAANRALQPDGNKSKREPR